MFSHLSFSRPVTGRRAGTIWSAGFSITVHALAGLVFIALAPAPGEPPSTPRVDSILIDYPVRPRRSAARRPTEMLPSPGGGRGWDRVVVPVVEVPDGIPPIDTGSLFDPRAYGRDVGGVGNPLGSLGVGDSDGDVMNGAFAARVLDDPPVWLAGPPPRYPPLLRAAAIAGHVTLEFVIDSTGHPEPDYVRVIGATHSAFVEEARRAILGSVYRPGRLRGRAVRVLVTQEVVFRLDKRGGSE